MIIKNIKISDFRNFSVCELEPSEEINIICGDNAVGKTNIIEAIWLLTGAKSFRNVKDNELIKIEKNESQIEANIISGGIENNLKIKIKEKRQYFLNGKRQNNQAEIIGKFCAVVFSPTDLNLVTDSPSVRRRFIDIAVCQLFPKYIEILRNYNRAVIQRNNILKDCIKDASLKFLLEDFEKGIIEYGEKIVAYRKRYIERLNEHAPKIYSELSREKEFFEIEYVCSYKESFKEELLAKKPIDILHGVTSVGPHRDDILFKINGFNAKEYSSQGQKRSICLALKLSEANIIENIIGEKPVTLLDDVMSELDKHRQNYILNHIKDRQVFITCCDKSNFDELEKGKIFYVENGQVK